MGKPINLKQDFLVVTNNYRSGGGGKFPGLDGSTVVIHAPDKNRDVVANYLLTQNKIDPKADQNWSFSDTFGSATVSFKTSPKAKNVAPKSMTFVEVGEDGFAEFTLN